LRLVFFMGFRLSLTFTHFCVCVSITFYCRILFRFVAFSHFLFSAITFLFFFAANGPNLIKWLKDSLCFPSSSARLCSSLGWCSPSNARKREYFFFLYFIFKSVFCAILIVLDE